MAQTAHRSSDVKDKATDRLERMAEGATDQLKMAADKAEAMAGRVADQGRDAGQRVQEVAGNFQKAMNKSVKDQPTATLALAAVVGFVLGAIWKA